MSETYLWAWSTSNLGKSPDSTLERSTVRSSPDEKSGEEGRQNYTLGELGRHGEGGPLGNYLHKVYQFLKY